MKLSILLILLFATPACALAQNEVVGTKSTIGALDEKPSYPGGLQAMMNFISENTVYPEAAIKKSIQGKVVVKFVIDTIGKVSNASIVISVDPLLDSEAVRVVRLMDGWSPGRMKNKKVPVFYTLPINFKLPD
jgi:periplasmic protein TonB